MNYWHVDNRQWKGNSTQLLEEQDSPTIETNETQAVSKHVVNVILVL